LQAGARRLDHLQAHLAQREFLLDAWRVADAYLTTVLNWHRSTGVDLARWPVIQTYFERMCARPATARAMAEETALYAEELRGQRAAAWAARSVGDSRRSCYSHLRCR
jgi:glutathione S-transferase